MGTGMQRMVEKVFFALIRFEINGDELCDEVKNLITLEMLPALFKLSKRHDLAHLIGDALEKNGLLPDGSETKKRFLRERNMAVYRYEQIQYEFKQICETLENAKVPFIPLKGSVIRKYYQEPWMRTSCDIDILVKKEDIEKATIVLKQKLSYEEGTTGSHDVNLFAPSGVHLELHFSLAETEGKWKAILEDVWTQKCEEWKYQFVMSNELLYFYHIVHMAVHMRTGGCGIKPFLDLQILHHHITYNREGLEELLRKGGLLNFEREAVGLSNAWFLGDKLSETGDSLRQYVLYGGVYGTLENKVAVQQIKTGGKVAYLFSRIFVGFQELSIKYPSLKKHKWLFPFYQVYRWFDLLINKKSRQYTKATIHQTRNTTDERLQLTEKLFQEIGL